MPKMKKASSIQEEGSEKKQRKNKKKSSNKDDEAFFNQSSSNRYNFYFLEEIEDQLNMKPQENKIKKSRKNRKVRKRRQHAVDSDSSINRTSVMTQGWGVTGKKNQNNDSTFDHSSSEINLYNKPPKFPRKSRKNERKEWIGNNSQNLSLGSQGSSEGVWVTNP